MSYNLRIHVADVTTDTAYIMLSTLDNANAVTATCSAGSVVVGTITDKHGSTYIGTGKITITGLLASTKYTYTVTQGSESYSGSFRTKPSTQTEKHSLIFATCTNWRARQPTCYKDIKNTILEYESIAPVVKLMHIDDVCYVDDLEVSSSTTLPSSSGAPQDTGLVSDFAIAWAAWHGHEPQYGMFTEDNFQWVLRNVSHNMSGGDHMTEGNHCRGQIGAGDYHGCNRGAGAAVANLEENSIEAWDSFIGDGNPVTLGSGTDMHWGTEIGPVRYVSPDTIKYSVPYDGADTTNDLFGATQLAEIKAYLNVDTVPFKCMMMETGFSRVGQPWREWWTTEADAWHADFSSLDNLNSTDGHFFGLVGDNHTFHAQSFDGGTGAGFWAFCPGTTGNSNVAVVANPTSIPPEIGTKTGNARYWRFVNSGGSVGDVQFSGFLHIIVHADESPQRLEVRGIEGGGNEVFNYEMTAVTGNDNQFTNSRSNKIGFK